jgi:hypothetical protein
VTVAAAVFYGTTRFRAAAEPSMVLLATAGFALLWSWLWRKKTDDDSAAGAGRGVDEPVAGPGDEVAALPGS